MVWSEAVRPHLPDVTVDPGSPRLRPWFFEKTVRNMGLFTVNISQPAFVEWFTSRMRHIICIHITDSRRRTHLCQQKPSNSRWHQTTRNNKSLGLWVTAAIGGKSHFPFYQYSYHVINVIHTHEVRVDILCGTTGTTVTGRRDSYDLYALIEW